MSLPTELYRLVLPLRTEEQVRHAQFQMQQCAATGNYALFLLYYARLTHPDNGGAACDNLSRHADRASAIGVPGEKQQGGLSC